MNINLLAKKRHIKSVKRKRLLIRRVRGSGYKWAIKIIKKPKRTYTSTYTPLIVKVSLWKRFVKWLRKLI